jgi:large subunit ribosomal protein L22
VAQAHVGKNIVMRRFHARGRGKMSPVEKPFSQLTVVVKEIPAEAAEEPARGGRGGTAGATAQAEETA